MATAVRIETLYGGTYDFDEIEVGHSREWTAVSQIKVESQLGDPTIYDDGIDHYRATFEFITVFASTISNLNLVRLIRDRFWLYPHYMDDTDLKYCVVLWNPEAIFEAWYHGHPHADQIITLEFREFTGAVCYPPTPGS
jgi:hypothetical protein